MKKLLSLLFLTFCVQSLSAQDLVGRKIISGSVNVSVIAPGVDQSHIVNIASSVLTGKIKENLTYWAWGGNFSIASSSPNDIITVGPSVERGKFILLVDKLYLAPYLGGNISGTFAGNTGGIQVGAYASPLRFMYHLKENFLISAGFGAAGLSYSNISGSQIFSLNASLTNHSSFGVFYTFK